MSHAFATHRSHIATVPLAAAAHPSHRYAPSSLRIRAVDISAPHAVGDGGTSDASPLCIRGVPRDVEADLHDAEGRAGGVASAVVVGAGGENPRRCYVMDPVRAGMEGGAAGGGGGLEFGIQRSEVCSILSCSSGSRAGESGEEDLLRGFRSGEGEDAALPPGVVGRSHPLGEAGGEIRGSPPQNEMGMHGGGDAFERAAPTGIGGSPAVSITGAGKGLRGMGRLEVNSKRKGCAVVLDPSPDALRGQRGEEALNLLADVAPGGRFWALQELEDDDDFDDVDSEQEQESHNPYHISFGEIRDHAQKHKGKKNQKTSRPRLDAIGSELKRKCAQVVGNLEVPKFR